MIIMFRCVEHDDGMGENGLVGGCFDGIGSPAYELLKHLFDNPAQVRCLKSSIPKRLNWLTGGSLERKQ